MKYKPSYFLLTLLGIILILNFVSGSTQSSTGNFLSNYNQPVNLPLVNDYTVSSLTVQTLNNTWLDFKNMSQGYISVDNKSTQGIFSNNTGLTYSFWIKRQNKSENQQIISRKVNSGISLYLDTSYRINVDIYNTTSVYSNINSLSIPLENVWTYIVITHNGSEIIVYNNGQIAKTITKGNLRNSQGGLNIGASGGGVQLLNGSLDNIIIYNRSLDNNEILNLYNLGLTSYINNFSIITYLEKPYINAMYINGSGVFYGLNWTDGALLRRNNYTSNFTRVAMLPFQNSRMMFIDSRNTLFLGAEGTNRTYRSMGNDSNWTIAYQMPCGGSDASVWSMTEDTSRGQLFIGEYTYNNAKCPYIYNSTNGGMNFTLFMNGTQLFGSGRHIHKVKFNPYNNFTYASFGDNASENRLIRYNGSTWEEIYNGSNSNFIAMEFTPNYRFFGSDEHNLSSVFRTTDDITFTKVFTLSGNEQSNLWSSTQDSRGNIYFGTVGAEDNYNASIYVTSDYGLNFYKVYLSGLQTAYQGIFTMTGFDNDGFSYFFNGTNTLRFSGLNYLNPVLDFKFSENNGSIVYDRSGLSNNGLIYNATWNNDTILSTLTSGVDYRVTLTGVYTLLNPIYSYAKVYYSMVSTFTEANTACNAGVSSFSSYVLLLGLVGVVFFMGLIVSYIAGFIDKDRFKNIGMISGLITIIMIGVLLIVAVFLLDVLCGIF